MAFPCAEEFRLNAAGETVPYVTINGVQRPVGFASLPGSQTAFLACSDLICLYESGRGVGKTLSAILDFCQFDGIGLGNEHKGLFVRRTHPELAEAISLARIWIPKLFPGASYNKMFSAWQFPDGAELSLSHILDEDDTDRFLGHSYTWICCDELCSWPTLGAFKFLLSCLRSTHPKAMLHMRGLTNPYGVGRSEVMQYFGLPMRPGTVVGPLVGGDDAPTYDSEGNREPARRCIHGHFSENLLLAPDYMERVLGSTDDPAKKKAWSVGSWEEPSDSIFGDIFTAHRASIEIPSFKVPTPEKIRISYDFGSLAPGAVLFWWESNGDAIEMADGSMRDTKKGDLFIHSEIYFGKKNTGLKLSVGETAARIKLHCLKYGYPETILRREGNIADGIFSEDGRESISTIFEKASIKFEPASKGPGSRVQGVALLRKWLTNAAPVDGERTEPGLFVCEGCTEWWRQIPYLQRDKRNLEDVDSDQMDHVFDATKYYLARENLGPAVLFSGRVDAVRRGVIR